MTEELAAGFTTTDPRLDRVPFFDTRSRGFAIRAMLPEALPLRSFGWACPTWLDQGSEGACVGFSWSHELAASPVRIDVTNETARELYHAAQKVDEWPGENYSGTSVLAGAKTVKAQGFMDEYRWGFGVEDALRAIGYFGPVVIGINWYPSMFDPRPSGLLEVDRESAPAGGHAILVRGVGLRTRLPGESRMPVVRLRNSWGKDWGRDGDCWIKIEDFEWLLDQQGECCIPVNRHHAPIADGSMLEHEDDY